MTRRIENRWAGWKGTWRLVIGHPANQHRKARAMLTFAGWQVWKRAVRHPLTITFWPGVRMRAYPHSPIATAAICTGLPDYHEMHFMLRYLRPGDTVVDVGANVGIYSLLAASVVAAGRVIAFEPDPIAARRLRENATLNRFANIELRPIAVGAGHGVVHLTADLDVMNHVVEGSDSVGMSRRQIAVPLSALDTETQSMADLAFIKIDAEGFETEILAGASGLLRRSKPPVWMVEVNGFGLRYRRNDAAIHQIFVDAGYRPYLYDAPANTLRRADDPSSERRANMLFIRDPAPVRARLASVAADG